MINSDNLDDALFKKVETACNKYLDLPIISSILQRLETELPPTLHYHSVHHTKDVLTEGIKFGIIGGLRERELELLAIASAYHDAGYLFRLDDNEVLAAELIETTMKVTGTYSEDEIKIVSDMIIDTKLNDLGCIFVRTISSHIAEYLLDADLSNLGRDDFFDKGELLKKELSLSHDIFYSLTLKLLDKHQWHTEAADGLRGKRAIENFEAFKKRG
jgi:predicted metal-dependent HD superfamily phosphohydrolase